MLLERALTESDIPLLASIDRTELIHECYRLEGGELVLYPDHHDMARWRVRRRRCWGRSR